LKFLFLPWIFFRHFSRKSFFLLRCWSFFPSAGFALIPFGFVVVSTHDESEAEAT
jgi:hypothetical protein